MKYKIVIPLLFSLSLIFSSCGGSSNNESSDDVSTPDTFSLAEKEFVHNLFLTEYLWYDEVASNVEYSNFTTPQSLIDELKVNPPDQWSFSITSDVYEDFANQKTIGFGFEYTSDFKIILVRIDAPAYGKLLRGDEILEINGEAVSVVNIENASKNIDSTTTFTLLRDGSEISVNVKPKEYLFKVTLGKIINKNGTKVGYLRYDSFTETSVSEFEEEFTKFKEENITELVIDLRYNGGGSVATTSALLDNISGTHAGERQMYLDWNSNYKSKNVNYYFENADVQDGNELDMKRVVFLVTKDSASASEALINALVPYLGISNIITIGDNTHGKPVGMSGKVYGDNYYFLINFFVKNSASNSTSFDGIAATCVANDDLTHIMGDENETMLKTALEFIDINSLGQTVCP
jgi:hypothetical protein